MFSEDIGGFASGLQSLRDFVDLVGPYVEASAKPKTGQKPLLSAALYLLNRVDPDRFALEQSMIDRISEDCARNLKIDVRTVGDSEGRGKSVTVSGSGAERLFKGMQLFKTFVGECAILKGCMEVPWLAS